MIFNAYELFKLCTGEIVPMVIEDETRKNSLDVNSHSPFNSSHCEARYYYNEEVSPGRFEHSYQFRCQFSDGKPGEIKQFPCGNRISCLSILRNRPLVRTFYNILFFHFHIL